jgi:hypothetical protein
VIGATLFHGRLDRKPIVAAFFVPSRFSTKGKGDLPMSDATVHQLKNSKLSDDLIQNIGEKDRLLFESAIRETEFWLNHVAVLIDEMLGDGYAAKHPKFFGEVLVRFSKGPLGVDAYLGDIIECIDQDSGKGYAARHPELISAFLKPLQRVLKRQQLKNHHN